MKTNESTKESIGSTRGHANPLFFVRAFVYVNVKRFLITAVQILLLQYKMSLLFLLNLFHYFAYL